MNVLFDITEDRETLFLCLIKYHSVKVCGEIFPWILKLGSRWGGMVSFMTRPPLRTAKKFLVGLSIGQVDGQASEKKKGMPLPEIQLRCQSRVLKSVVRGYVGVLAYKHTAETKRKEAYTHCCKTRSCYVFWPTVLNTRGLTSDRSITFERFCRLPQSLDLTGILWRKWTVWINMRT
jgi:hypothetical protein